MTISISIVDHSGLDRTGLSYIAAMRDFHKALDPHFGLRHHIGLALDPAPRRLLPLGNGLLLIAEVKP